MFFLKRGLPISLLIIYSFTVNAQTTLTWGCGTYLGSGAASKSITGLGFQPDVVILKAFHNADGYIKTSAMAANESKSFNNAASNTTRITSLDADGFTVGNTAETNTLNRPYSWIAFKKETGYLAVGSYTGNTTDNTDIVMTDAFQPNYVIVIPKNADFCTQRTSTMTGDYSVYFNADEQGYADGIQAFNTDGFEIGDNGINRGGGSENSINESGAIYYYVAFKELANYTDVGTYTGNGVSPRTYNLCSLDPDYGIIIPNTGSDFTAQRNASHHVGQDSSLLFHSASRPFEQIIQSFITNGFTLGSDPSANANGSTYHFIAFDNARVIITLPINLLSFSARAMEDDVQLLWATASETNNDFFTLERTLDGSNFETLGIVKGAGNSTRTLTYDFLDEEPLNEMAYYRLKQTDYDGKFAYSDLVAVSPSIMEPEMKLQVFPNPSNGSEVNIFVSGIKDETADLVIYDALGKRVHSEKLNEQDGFYAKEIFLNEKLAFGVYSVMVTCKTQSLRSKLIVN